MFGGESLAHNLPVVTRLQRLAADLGATVSQLAIAWTIARPGVDVAIVGAQHITYLHDSVGAADVTLTDAVLAAIDKILTAASSVGGPYPEMHAEAR